MSQIGGGGYDHLNSRRALPDPLSARPSTLQNSRWSAVAARSYPPEPRCRPVRRTNQARWRAKFLLSTSTCSKMGLFYADSQLRSSMRRRLFIAVVWDGSTFGPRQGWWVGDSALVAGWGRGPGGVRGGVHGGYDHLKSISGRIRPPRVTLQGTHRNSWPWIIGGV